jgi:hypothetical protein
MCEYKWTQYMEEIFRKYFTMLIFVKLSELLILKSCSVFSLLTLLDPALYFCSQLLCFVFAWFSIIIHVTFICLWKTLHNFYCIELNLLSRIVNKFCAVHSFSNENPFSEKILHIWYSMFLQKKFETPNKRNICSLISQAILEKVIFYSQALWQVHEIFRNKTQNTQVSIQRDSNSMILFLQNR